jgi:hypothetical protein
MKTLLRFFFISGFLCAAILARAQTPEPPTTNKNQLFNLSLEELLDVSIDELSRDLKLYGFINTNAEKQFNFLGTDTNGLTTQENDPFVWTPVKSFHLYGSAYLSNKIDVLFNLAYADGAIEVRNAWGNFKVNQLLQVRVGKMYRRFGLYNERLDQIPTFVGIEPPEIFDNDHLFITRTTNFMLHGNKDFGSTNFQYSLTTENAEGGEAIGIIPLGWDFRFKSDQKSFIIGTSGFASSINGDRSTSAAAFNDGPPEGGILPWMDGDFYTLTGLFVEKQFGRFHVQAEYWNARHDALRNPTNVLEIVRNAGINSTQRENFLGVNSSKPDGLLVESDVIVPVTYNVETFYIRLAYNIDSNIGSFAPYIFLDWMSHPEVISNKNYGGDKESGLADDGIFNKPSLGVVYRPIPAVAIKLDGSIHQQKFNGATERYPELRLDFSWAFKN